ncbi:ATP-binding protein [Kribbella qitaiheensis]|uniref:ATP-binding protein n=1 Tax=Kribbella qitaiheensis TaxID=1544730 RepID=UPI0036201521
MRELPAGRVSMLFSDIEGSTLLLTRLGPTYVEVLDSHRRILRDVWAATGGTEVGTEGDSFFVVFPTATAALTAAAEGQRRLADHHWPGGERLRVRMGIHTGSPGLHDGDYWGMDVHRAARISSSANGGQVVISAATGDLAELSDGISLRDLGTHHLKDIREPEHLYQLTVAGLQQDFPPLRTLGTPTSLPATATPLLGRDSDLARLTEMLCTPDNRLVTLTGPGGSGKTRLAISAAAELKTSFPDGVYFVPLAAEVSEEVMCTSIAEVLDLGTRERTPAGLLKHLTRHSLLLVLDNLEQLEGAAKVVAQILEAAPRVAVIATSRRPLGLIAERLHPVTPLTLPDDLTLAAAQSSGAVQLFVQRAQAVQPGFTLTNDNVDDVVTICRRLDGLPLAIELCATRVRLLSPKALLDRIDQALDIVSTSSVTPERQRTLRDTIAWSYHLLSPVRRRVFRQLAVFSGGADLDAVATVACTPQEDPLDIVAELIDASLVTMSEGPDGGPRIALLETISQYADDELRAAGEAEAARGAHAEYYATVAEKLLAMREESTHVTALELAETELDNFRAALGWAVPPSDNATGDLATGLRLCAALGWVWVLGGYFAEGRRWHELVVARAGAEPSRDLVACLRGLGNLLVMQGETARAEELATRSVKLAETLDDHAGIALALSLLGTVQLQLGDLEAARDTLGEALDRLRLLDDKRQLARVLGNLGGVEEELGRFDRAETMMMESQELFEDIGDVHESTVQGQNLAYLLVVADRLDEASELAAGLVHTVVTLGSPSLLMAFSNTVMNILIRQGHPARAAHLFGAEEAMRDRLEMPNPYLEEELGEALELIDGVMSREDWEKHRLQGRQELVEDLLAQFPSNPR